MAFSCRSSSRRDRFSGDEMKRARKGLFLGCARYPECKSTMPVDEEGRPARPALTDIACPACGRMFKVPTLDGLQKALSVADAAKGAIYVDEDGNVYG